MQPMTFWRNMKAEFLRRFTKSLDPQPAPVQLSAILSLEVGQFWKDRMGQLVRIDGPPGIDHRNCWQGSTESGIALYFDGDEYGQARTPGRLDFMPQQYRSHVGRGIQAA